MQFDMHLLKMNPAMNARNTNHGNMAFLPPPCFHELVPRPSHKLYCNKNMHRFSLQVIRAHNCKDEGRSSNMVDANLRILRERIEEVRNKERLERCCTSEQGWNYTPVYSSHYKREAMLSQCLQLVGLVFGTAGLTILSATFFLCLLSLLLHLKQ